MALKGDMASGKVLAVEQSMKGRGIMGFKMDMEQKRMLMEVRFTVQTWKVTKYFYSSTELELQL